MAVRFLKKYHTYNEGEVAGFSEQHEKWLVSKRIAEPAPSKKKAAPTAEEDDVAKGQASEPQKKNPEGPQHRQTTVSSKK